MVKKFILGILVILVLYSLIAWGISFIVQFSKNQILGLQISGILATVNVVIAFLIIYLAKDKEQANFAKIFLGGMAVRLVAMIVFIFIIFRYSRADHFVFIGSLFILYFVYQIWEVYILNSSQKKG